jgi:hypothetical protein
MDSEERQKKILMMKIGVGAIIVLIFLLWVFNMKNLWRPIMVNNEGANTQDLTKFKSDINNQMTEINQRLNDISNQKQEATNKAGNDLLNNVINGAANSTSSSETSTSSPINTSTNPVVNAPDTTKVKNSKCPPYIDCMPTIGASKPCQIPAGCEGITQIAY